MVAARGSCDPIEHLTPRRWTHIAIAYSLRLQELRVTFLPRRLVPLPRRLNGHSTNRARQFGVCLAGSEPDAALIYITAQMVVGVQSDPQVYVDGHLACKNAAVGAIRPDPHAPLYLGDPWYALYVRSAQCRQCRPLGPACCVRRHTALWIPCRLLSMLTCSRGRSGTRRRLAKSRTCGTSPTTP
jgi:hypothetical protein